MIRHIKRATRHLIFWSLMAASIGLLAVRVLLSVVDKYKAELASEISQQVNAPVTIGHLKTLINGFTPQLALEDISIMPKISDGKNTPNIQLKEMRLGINLIDFVLSRDLLSSSTVTLVGAKITIKKQADGSIAIVGLKAGSGQPLWLLQGRQYLVLQSTVIWQDEQKHGKALQFDDVNIMIKNDGDRHRVNILMNLTHKQGKQLSAVLDIKGNIFEPNAIEGKGYIEGQAINLPEWITFDLPITLKIKSGVSDVKVWLNFQDSKLASLVGDVQAEKLQLSRQNKPDFSSKHFSTRFFWDKHDYEWKLDVEQFLLETVTKKYPASAFSVSATSAEDGQLHKIALSSQEIDVEKFANLTSFFVPLVDEHVKLLAQAQAKGLLKNLTLSADMDQQLLSVNGQFVNFSLSPIATYPGVENFTGQISGNEQQGSLTINTKNAKINYPDLFRNSLLVNKLKGSLTWQQTADNWTLASSLLTIDTPDIKSDSRLQLIIPKNAQPTFMDLQTTFSGKDMSKAPTYYPTSVMSKTLVDWLDHSFISGTLTKGDFLFYGNLKDFPFEKNDGVFEVLFHAKQLELLYHPDWPHLHNLEGDVLFTKDELQVQLNQGNTEKITIQQAKIAIPSLSKGERVLVDGIFSGSFADTLTFLQKTPLDLSIDKVSAAITPRGNTEASLKLTVPLEDYIPVKVDGAAKINNASLTVNSLDLLVDKMNGALKFNEKGIYSDTINALALGHPVQINIKSDDKKTTIKTTGRTSIDELHKQFKMSGWQIAKGVSDYQLELQLPYGDQSSELNIQSNLAGISFNLPDDLAKTSEQKRAISMNFSLVDQPLLPIKINYDNKLKAALNVATKNRHIESGYLLVGPGEVGKPPKTGIKLEINREQLALQEWLEVAFTMAETESAATPTANTIQEIKVHSNSSLWKNTPLGLFDLNLKPSANQWQGTLESPFAKGNISIPFDLKGTNRITMNMDELDLSLLKQLSNKKTSQTFQPFLATETMPLLTLNSQKTRWQNIELGRLSLIAQRTANGMNFKNITLNGDKQKLNLSGEWQVNGKQSITRAQGRLEMLRADELFKQFDISKDFSKTSGIADFKVSWQGAPQQFSIANLQGQLDLELNEGRLLSVEPGFGRILGVLAVGQWIKRLQLDFSDIYEEGLSFDSIKGHFDLVNGNAHTNNLIVDAIPAKITITGDTDLLHRTMNNTIMVAPKSADAVPIAGTIMGKAASFIGKSLTGKDQDGFFFGSQYSVKGEWGKVQIIPHHENDGLLKKTWNGLTDFSWLNQQKTKKEDNNE